MQGECTTGDKPYLTREFSLEGPGILKAFTPAGNIEVQRISDSNKVRVELYLDRGYAFWSNNNNLDNYRIRVFQKGSEVIASVEMKKKETGFFSDQVSFSFKIYVPESMSTELKTSGGNVKLSGLQGNHLVKLNAGNISVSSLKGLVRLYTAGGNIDISNSMGTIYAKTTGGNITANDNKGELRLQAHGGRILAQRLTGTLLAKLDAGDIKAQFTRVTEGVSLETAAGNIYLEIPDMTGYDLILKGSSVSMPNDIGFQGSSDFQKVEGKIKQGGIPINLTSHTGNVVLKLN